MKTNLTVVPLLITKNFCYSMKVFRALRKFFWARFKRKKNFGYNHFKNLRLIYFKLTAECNQRCIMCGQYGDKGVMKNNPSEHAKKILPLETWKKVVGF